MVAVGGLELCCDGGGGAPIVPFRLLYLLAAPPRDLALGLSAVASSRSSYRAGPSLAPRGQRFGHSRLDPDGKPSGPTAAVSRILGPLGQSPGRVAACRLGLSADTRGLSFTATVSWRYGGQCFGATGPAFQRPSARANRRL
jgi:hypothetical protein